MASLTWALLVPAGTGVVWRLARHSACASRSTEGCRRSRPRTGDCLDRKRTCTCPGQRPLPTFWPLLGQATGPQGTAPAPVGTPVWAAAGLPPSPPALQGPASDQGGPCSQLEAADEGGPVPRLPFSCRQREDSQKEALFSEQGARSPAPGGNAEAAGPSEAV